MPDDRRLVLAFFPSEAGADGAAGALRAWARANRRVELDAVGVLVKHGSGEVKTHKLGPSEGRKGIGIGVALGAVAAVASGGLTLVEGAALGGAGGGLVGAVFRKGLGMSDEDAARIGSRLDAGHAAVGALLPDNQAAAIVAELEALGGQGETHVLAAEAEAIPAT